MIKKISNLGLCALLASAMFVSCSKDDDTSVVTSVITTGKDINSATKASVDRFSATAGHLMIRTATNGLPAANAAINFDNQPFITQGFGRTGLVEKYYNFDVQPDVPAAIYVFFKNGATAPLSGQNNVIDVKPGDAGYNDFWVVNKVTVPDAYIANTLTNKAAILASGYAVTPTTTIVNCPVVPFGSTALKSKTAGVASALTLGWYKDQAVAYFNFDEAPITATSTGKVPVVPIWVMFNDNATGPASGFKTETANPNQTHNVLGALTSDSFYSPLWQVVMLNNSAFATVNNRTTAEAAPVLNPNAGLVNCPVVK